MHETKRKDNRGRVVIRRTWCNTDGELHRTTGPAREDWTILPGGAHVLSYQAWCQNGKDYREGRPAYRRWHVVDDGTRVLEIEAWRRDGMEHRLGGPAYRHWTVGPDGTRTLALEWWFANGRRHYVDGPAYYGRGFLWHGRSVEADDVPWLRRGRHGLIVPLALFTRAAATMCWSVSPAWSQDTRVAATWLGFGYRSAVGGALLLCV